ncbi:putative inactive purple acid phosphatase 27 [Vitis vinifera]|uniref:Purple acid phosphatase n=1 Tax=Vitis vinifera TaxID=29760 RepID=A0A438EY96_VITVI|nr:putative inactive purple acid phosphatase 27 [Vitis vinifera]
MEQLPVGRCRLPLKVARKRGRESYVGGWGAARLQSLPRYLKEKYIRISPKSTVTSFEYTYSIFPICKSHLQELWVLGIGDGGCAENVGCVVLDCVKLLLLWLVDGFVLGEQPLSKIAIHRITLGLSNSTSIRASPILLGSNGEDTEWVSVDLEHDNPSVGDWIGVFSPANFNSSTCLPESSESEDQTPYICSAPIKYKFVKDTNSGYTKTGKASLKFQIINQRADFSLCYFQAGCQKWPKLVAVSNSVSFANPKAPLYPRLALGKAWNDGLKGGHQKRSPAGTSTFHQNSMCGSPARTVGWRDPGFIHTSFLKDLWPNARYNYRMGHLLSNGSYVWSRSYSFRSSPFPGQDSLQRVIIFGDLESLVLEHLYFRTSLKAYFSRGVSWKLFSFLAKNSRSDWAERDGSNEYSNYQPGSLNTTDQLIKDLPNFDIVFHIGDLPYSNGTSRNGTSSLHRWSRWRQLCHIWLLVVIMNVIGQFGSYYDGTDSGGECGVPAETTFYFPAKNRSKFWYSADYGMFHFCVADTENDWRKGTEQYRFLEHCLASVDRRKQPWLIFTGHRVLGYSSDFWYALEGSYAEPGGRENLQKLWQKYKVDIALFGHVHNYERTCPIYQNRCVNPEKSHYSGTVNGLSISWLEGREPLIQFHR